MAISLPDDILFLITEEAAKARDFDTLFNSALASRRVASAALTHLYREHHNSPVRGDKNETESAAIAQQELIVQKWSILWRSIIASSMSATLFPYCRYIKVLDLRDLEHLLDDSKFRGKISKTFFAKSMSKFNIVETTAARKSGRKYQRLNITAILNAVGNAVTEHTPMVELISGKILPEALRCWSSRLPHLRSLELYKGDTIGNDSTQYALQQNCTELEALSIYSWHATETMRDQKLAGFISGMKENRLRALTIFSDCGVAAETFLALRHHGLAISTLKLSLRDDALPHLGLLKSCVNVQHLKLEDCDRRTDLKSTQNDVFLEMVDWLRSCKQLRELELTRFTVGAELAQSILFEDTIHLEKLYVDSYSAKDHRGFHQALANQKGSLRSLFLDGDSDAMTFDDLEIITDSIAQLTELRELELRNISDYLQDHHVQRMVQDLAHLEDLFTSGISVSDMVLPAISRLKYLKSATFTALSTFTSDGLLKFVENCGPGNHSITFAAYMADPNNQLSEEEQEVVRHAFVVSLGGRFEYTLLREPGFSEFEQSDSE